MPALPLLPRQLLDELAKAPRVATRTSHGEAASLVVRQQDSAATTLVVIPETYGSLHDSLSPGAIVGIVIGSVVGFILLLLVIYTILGFGPMSSLVRTAEVTESKSYVSRSMLSSSRRKSEKPKKKVPSMHGARVLSIRRERTTRTSNRRSERRGKEPVIVEPIRKREPSPLTTISSSSGAGPAPRRDHLPSDYDEENEVVVIEETTPSSRRHSRKVGPSRNADGGQRRSRSRRSSYSEDDDRRYRR